MGIYVRGRIDSKRDHRNERKWYHSESCSPSDEATRLSRRTLRRCCPIKTLTRQTEDLESCCSEEILLRWTLEASMQKLLRRDVWLPGAAAVNHVIGSSMWLSR
jgi:hypothetical protein